MGPALARLSHFPNVLVVACCSMPQNLTTVVKPGRPTDYLPPLLQTYVLYACGAPAMVDSVKSIASNIGAACYADTYLPTTETAAETALARAMWRLSVQTS